MSNLIITVISIALVSISALMGVFYGGEAFFRSQSRAVASTMVNQAEQIMGAWHIMATRSGGSYLPHGAGTDMSVLLSPNYIQEIPTPPTTLNNNASQWLRDLGMVVSFSTQFDETTGGAADICRQINMQTGIGDTIPVGAPPAGQWVFFCISNGASPATYTVTYRRLGT